MRAVRATRSFLAVMAITSGAALALGDNPKVAPPPAAVSPAPAAGAATPADSMGRVSAGTPSTYAHGTSVSKEIHWVRDSAEYKANAVQAFHWATRLVDEKAKGETSGTWAIVTDADETILDNSQFQKEVGSEGFTPPKWTAWVRRREAAAVPGAAAFLRHVHELGGKVIVVTNRKMPEQEDTVANLKAVGLENDLVLSQVRPEGKDGRFEMVTKGTAAPGLPALKVLLYLGDNIQDFPKTKQDIRLKPEAELADFGEKYLVIPNPMYGSWVNNPER